MCAKHITETFDIRIQRSPFIILSQEWLCVRRANSLGTVTTLSVIITDISIQRKGHLQHLLVVGYILPCEGND